MKFGTGKCNQQCKGSKLCVSFSLFFFYLRGLAVLEDSPLEISMLGMCIAFPKA